MKNIRWGHSRSVLVWNQQGNACFQGCMLQRVCFWSRYASEYLPIVFYCFCCCMCPYILLNKLCVVTWVHTHVQRTCCESLPESLFFLDVHWEQRYLCAVSSASNNLMCTFFFGSWCNVVTPDLPLHIIYVLQLHRLQHSHRFMPVCEHLTLHCIRNK